MPRNTSTGPIRDNGRPLLMLFLQVWLLLVALVGTAIGGWQVYLPSDGLLNDYLTDADAGPSGEVWLLSLDGVSRFDGLTWTNWTVDDIPRIDFPYEILADSRGRVWVTDYIDNTIAVYDGEVWKGLDYITGGIVWDMAEDSDGNIWFATGDGLLKYDGSTWKHYDEGDGLGSSVARAVTQSSDGSIWVATGAGVSSFDGTSWTNYTKADGLGDLFNRVIIEDDRGRVWVGGHPLSRFDGETWATFGENEGVPFTFRPGGAANDQQGNLWFGVYGQGVMRFDGTEWKVFRVGDDYHITGIVGMTVDTYNNVWAATQLGAARFDGEDWRWLEPRPDNRSNRVRDIAVAGPGELWLATAKGVYYSDHGDFTLHGILDSLNSDDPKCMELLDDGELWVGGIRGIYIYDDEIWTFVPEDHMVTDIYQHTSGDIYFSLYDSCLVRISGMDTTAYYNEWGRGSVLEITEDRDGAVWVIELSSVGRLEGETWTWWHYEEDTIDHPRSIAAADNGDIWIGDLNGVSRFDGTTWTDYTGPEGVAAENFYAIYVDDRGYVWAGSETGSLYRFDGEHWTVFGDRDGLLPGTIDVITQDSGGRLLVGSDWGVSIGEMDRVPPRTFMDPAPPALTAGRRHVIPLAASNGETQGIRFSTSLDGGPWSPWTKAETWIVESLSDGVHDLCARAQDRWGNVDPRPVTAVVGVDGTPPSPVIASPGFGEAVRDTVGITGSVNDPRFESYRVLVRPVGTSGWDPPSAVVIEESENPPTGGIITLWNTHAFDEGGYDLEVEVSDTLGLTGTDLVSVIVDNEAPWAWETSPAVVKGSTGGDIYTTGREVHLYFPPHCFETEAEVTVEALGDGQVPDTLASGSRRLLTGYEIGWGDAGLKKAATLSLDLEDSGAGPEEHPALYMCADDSVWTRVGGTLAEGGSEISVSLSQPGWYALFGENGDMSQGTGLAMGPITPRVFSPQGGFGDTEAAISFTLGRSGPVTVKVYNRAGYLVRKVIEDKRLGAGANVVRWDGRNGGGEMVPAGLYLVTVEALGTKQTKTLSVVR